MQLEPRDVHVALLVGGRSAEREVSLNSGSQVLDGLETAGFRVTRVDAGDADFVTQLADLDADVAFICLHGRFGEDGTVQGLCELLDLPYVGSGVLASALAMDKVMSKHLFAHAGLSSPDYVALKRGRAYDIDAIVRQLGPRVVVKPANEGSAIGVTIVHSPAELPAAIEEAFRYDASVLVEAFVSGAEVTVGVLGNEDPVALPTLEIVPEHEFYDYESKYVPGMSRHIIPANVSEEARRECQRLSIEAHILLGCRGMSRSDTIVAEDGSVYLLEVNTIPGMTQTSLLPDAARAMGIDFPELCRRLVEFALFDRLETGESDSAERSSEDTRMHRIEWNPALQTGDERVDEHHRSLIAMFNELIDAENEGNAEARIQQTLEKLTEYVIVHFDAEEQMMREHGYPGAEVEPHVSEHRELVDRTRQMVLDYRTGKLDSLAPLVSMLYEWLTSHVHRRDMRLVSYLSRNP